VSLGSHFCLSKAIQSAIIAETNDELVCKKVYITDTQFHKEIKRCNTALELDQIAVKASFLHSAPESADLHFKL
jgi:hypothetical protein